MLLHFKILDCHGRSGLAMTDSQRSSLRALCPLRVRSSTNVSGWARAIHASAFQDSGLPRPKRPRNDDRSVSVAMGSRPRPHRILMITATRPSPSLGQGALAYGLNLNEAALGGLGGLLGAVILPVQGEQKRYPFSFGLEFAAIGRVDAGVETGMGFVQGGWHGQWVI